MHTPAPWRVAGKATGHVHGTDCLVAIVGNYRDKELLPFNRKRWDADARLIAAAPDLLRAAEQLYRWARHQQGFDATEWADVRSAIAAAKS